MMKRLLFVMSILSIVYTCYASDENGNPKMSRIDAYKIGYKNGYKKGEQSGILLGWKQARDFFKKLYKEKLQEYKEI
ncbi:MAG: hypothetical protein QW726_05360, partial [Fervidicoccaceae archaeon]